jgi:hypothetical protein
MPLVAWGNAFVATAIERDLARQERAAVNWLVSTRRERRRTGRGAEVNRRHERYLLERGRPWRQSGAGGRRFPIRAGDRSLAQYGCCISSSGLTQLRRAEPSDSAFLVAMAYGNRLTRE